jgi:mannose-1-phosphate guanylyltransferase/mannose-6-phosphate isomerase
MIVPVILSGGSGSRLWPLSRAAFPKQFLSLIGDDSLLGATIDRVLVKGNNIIGEEIQPPVIISNSEHRFIVASELQQKGLLGKGTIILEPSPRNTAPAIAVAALDSIHRYGSGALLLILPADHVIKDVGAFHQAVRSGIEAANIGKLVTFGVVPEAAHTGYGYIQVVKGEAGKGSWLPIARFVEKPNLKVAEEYVKSGDYFWNSGMFLFGAANFLSELGQFEPAILKACEAAYENRRVDLDFVRLEEDAFNSSPSNSIDYAVMEKTSKAVTIPLKAGWSDVGSWSSLWEIQPKDSSDNVTLGDVIVEDVHGCFIHSEGRLIAALGISDQVIVETSDAILIAAKDRVEEVKKIVTHLQAQGRQEYQFHKKVYRPWGSYETIALEDRFQVKRITVHPGQQLSIQMHHHRAEHWVVVKGTAVVGRGDEEILLGEDRSTYIPLGTKHYLKNPGLIPLELIEVQTGSYLGEDDIVRFTDVYGRV